MEKYVWIFYIVEFVIIFLLVYLLYRLFVLRKRDFLKIFKKDKTKNKKQKGKRTKAPINDNIPEVKLFIIRNKINLEKIDYEKLAKKIILMISLCMAISFTIAFEIFDKAIFKILVAAGLLIVTTFIGYRIIKLIYKKKGLIDNVQSSKN